MKATVNATLYNIVSNGTGQKSRFALDGKMAGGGMEADDQPIYYNALCTSAKRKQLRGASIYERMPGHCKLVFAQTVADSVRVNVAIFSIDPCTLGFYF